MASERLNMVVFLAVVMIMGGMQVQNIDAQTTHTVGGSIGWTINPQNANAYTDWAATQTFVVGDILVFNFTSGAHTAAEVTKPAYDACNTTNPITLWSTGPASVTLNSSGSHYYLCTLPSHCSLGQKLSITVASPPTPTPTPTPTASPPTPTPTPTASPPTPTPAATPTPSPTSAPTPTPTPSPTSAPTPTPTPSPTSAPTPAATSPSGSTPPPAPTPGSSDTPPSSPAPGSSSTDTPPSPSSGYLVAAASPLLTFLSIAMAAFYFY